MNDLQRELISGSLPVSQALRLSLHQLQKTAGPDVVAWIEAELHGYSFEGVPPEGFPQYRFPKGKIVGHSVMGGDIQPVVFKNVDIEQAIDHPALVNSVTELEDWIKADRPVYFGLNSKVTAALVESNSWYIPMIAYDPGTFKRVLEGVRTRLIKILSDQDQPQVGAEVRSSVTPQRDPRKVFVVHGRDDQARTGLFRFLRSLGLQPMEWTELVASTGRGAPYVGEVLDAGFAQAQAVVVMFTPDDQACLRPHLRQSIEPAFETRPTPQARPNVIFEAGMALGFCPDRTILVELGHLRPFSDLAGRHTVRLDNSTRKRQELANRLNTAGCAVNLGGVDWQTEGDLIPTEADAVEGDARAKEVCESLRNIIKAILSGIPIGKMRVVSKGAPLETAALRGVQWHEGVSGLSVLMERGILKPFGVAGEDDFLVDESQL
jgi:predicted nucleotide-binding protein